MFEDCMDFSGVEWCPGPDGVFGVCEAGDATADAPEVNAGKLRIVLGTYYSVD